MSEEKKKPSEMYPKVAECENKLNDLISEAISVGKEMFSAAEGKMFTPDIFFMGILNRTINLVDAILNLTESWNFVAAGSLVRLHLDTLLCLSYLRAIKNHDMFIIQVLEGKQLRNIKDEEGKKLTDTRLRDYARPLFPQIDNVYIETSRLVHFSNKHIFSSTQVIDEVNGNIGIFIGKGFLGWAEKDIISLLECTIAITNRIHAIVRGWILQKAKVVW